MKFIPGCPLIFLLLSVLIPKETEALAPLILTRLGQLAVRHGWTLAKMTYYAKCGTVAAPPEMKCQSTVFGIGMTGGQAKSTAKVYATMFGGKECGNYVGECETFKFLKGLTKIKIPKIPGIGK